MSYIAVEREEEFFPLLSPINKQFGFKLLNNPNINYIK